MWWQCGYTIRNEMDTLRNSNLLMVFCFWYLTPKALRMLSGQWFGKFKGGSFSFCFVLSFSCAGFKGIVEGKIKSEIPPSSSSTRFSILVLLSRKKHKFAFCSRAFDCANASRKSLLCALCLSICFGISSLSSSFSLLSLTKARAFDEDFFVTRIASDDFRLSSSGRFLRFWPSWGTSLVSSWIHLLNSSNVSISEYVRKLLNDLKLRCRTIRWLGGGAAKWQKRVPVVDAILNGAEPARGSLQGNKKTLLVPLFFAFICSFTGISRSFSTFEIMKKLTPRKERELIDRLYIPTPRHDSDKK